MAELDQGLPPDAYARALSPISAFEGEGLLHSQGTEVERIASFTVQLNRKTRQVNVRTGTVRYPRNRWLAQRVAEMVTFSTGPLTEGQLVPIFGTIYTVSRIQPEGRSNRGARIVLAKTPRHLWPGKVKIDAFAYAITDGGSISLSSTLRYRVNYDAVKQCFQLIRDGERLNRTGTLDVKERMVIDAGAGIQYQVIAVVTPDSQAKVPGWIEFRRLWPEVVPFGVEQTLEIFP